MFNLTNLIFSRMKDKSSVLKVENFNCDSFLIHLMLSIQIITYLLHSCEIVYLLVAIRCFIYIYIHKKNIRINTNQFFFINLLFIIRLSYIYFLINILLLRNILFLICCCLYQYNDNNNNIIIPLMLKIIKY